MADGWSCLAPVQVPKAVQADLREVEQIIEQYDRWDRFAILPDDHPCRQDYRRAVTALAAAREWVERALAHKVWDETAWANAQDLCEAYTEHRWRGEE